MGKIEKKKSKIMGKKRGKRKEKGKKERTG